MALNVWQRTIVDDAGDIIPNAEIEVFLAGTNTPVDLFSDVEGLTPIANPFLATSEGFARFYVGAGSFDIVATGGGSSITWENVQIGDISQPFASYAAAEAATVPAVIVRISFLDDDGVERSVVSDGSGDALTNSGGSRTWSPADKVTPSHWGAPTDGTDATEEAQAAIDFGYNRGRRVTMDAEHAVSSLSYYGGSEIVFELSGKLTRIGSEDFVLRSTDSPATAGSPPTGKVDRALIMYPHIDMNDGGGFGLLVECMEGTRVFLPTFKNAPSGTFDYDDGGSTGLKTYETAPIAVKGINGVYGCYYTVIDHPYMNNPDGVGGATDPSGNVGIYIGTTEEETGQRANTTVINNPVIIRFKVGALVEMAGDVKIYDPELSISEIGIQIGRGDGSRVVQRCSIFHPYTERCTTAGIHVTSDGVNTQIYGWGSASNTPTPLLDEGVRTANYSSSGDQDADYARFFNDEVRGVRDIEGSDEFDDPATIRFGSYSVRLLELTGGEGVKLTSSASGFTASFAPDNDDDTRSGVGSRRWKEGHFVDLFATSLEATDVEAGQIDGPSSQANPGRLEFVNTVVRITDPVEGDGIEFLSGSSGFNAALRPLNDNDTRGGTGGNRFTEIYAATGTINTSDAREKTPLVSLNEAELRVAKRLAKLFGIYQWLESVKAKGEDSARLHMGVTAQSVRDAFEEEGLDGFRYGVLCWDSWPAEPAEPARPGKSAILDDDGTVIRPATPATPAKPERPAGDRMGIREGQLHSWIAVGFEQRLAALEDALT